MSQGLEITPNPITFEDTEAAFEHKSNRELKKAYRLFQLFNKQSLVKVGSNLTSLALRMHLPVTPFLKHTIYDLFVGGETLKETALTVNKLAKEGIGTILDYGVEGKQSETSFDRVLAQKLKMIQYAAGEPNVAVVTSKVTGLGRFALLEKIHIGEALTTKEEQEYQKLVKRMYRIAQACYDANTQVYFDAEETWIQAPLDDIVEKLMAEFNKEKAIVFNTYQLYAKDRLPYLKASAERARKGGYKLGAKLVRGAYMEKERERARELGYESPIHDNKDAVDRDFTDGLYFCLNNLDNISFCCATHNEYSCIYLTQLIVEQGIPRNHPNITFAQLFGMGEHITYNLMKNGYNALKLVPYGPVREVIPYLMRRAQENSSVDGQMSRELALIKKEMRRRGLIR